ncbi:MAG: hypothetical protein KAX80_15130, partial [Planctomycetes bacterium]|nr:hypothetical protein [Planctomycetota bacterium]
MAAALLCAQGWCDQARMKVLRDVSLPNLLQNGDFEQVRSAAFPHWFSWEEGYEVSAGRGRKGSTAARCHGARNAQGGVRQTLQLDQKAPTPVLVQAWSRAVGVTGRPDAHYSLYLDVYFSEGDPLYGQHAPFDTGTHGWQQRSVLVVPQRPIARMNIYGLFRNHAGQAWFDDFEAHDFSGQTVTAFDGLPVAVVPFREPGEEGTMYRTEDGLAFGYDWEDGRVSALRLGERDLTAARVASGFLVRDVAADSDFFGFPKGVCVDLRLGLTAEFTEHPDHLAV